MTELSELKIKVTVEGVDGAITEMQRLRDGIKKSAWSIFKDLAATFFVIVSTVLIMRGDALPAIWFMLAALVVDQRL